MRYRVLSLVVLLALSGCTQQPSDAVSLAIPTVTQERHPVPPATQTAIALRYLGVAIPATILRPAGIYSSPSTIYTTGITLAVGTPITVNLRFEEWLRVDAGDALFAHWVRILDVNLTPDEVAAIPVQISGRLIILDERLEETTTGITYTAVLRNMGDNPVSRIDVQVEIYMRDTNALISTSPQTPLADIPGGEIRTFQLVVPVQPQAPWYHVVRMNFTS
jgi:hypothetical protein